MLLQRFLEQVGPSILIGNSMGALISTVVATSQPDLVHSAVLVDPTLPIVGRLDVDPEVRRRFFVNGLPLIGEWTLQRRFMSVPARERVKETLSRCCADPGRIPSDMFEEMVALEEELTLQPGHAGAQLAASRSIVFGLARPASYWRRLSAVGQPVLLIHGTHDRLIPIASAHEAAKRYPHWTFRELDAGHVPQMETPDLVAGEILPWLEKVKEQSNA